MAVEEFKLYLSVILCGSTPHTSHRHREVIEHETDNMCRSYRELIEHETDNICVVVMTCK